MSKSSGVIHTTSVSRPQLKSYQVKDKVVPNISQVKFTKKEVEDHHRISSISKKTKSVTACNDSSNSRTSNANAVCAECGKCVFNSDHDACVSRYLKDVNARTKKPQGVPISASKPKRKANKSVATPHKKTVASDTTIQKSKSYFKELYENTNQEWKWWIAKRCPTGYTWTQKPLRTKKIWMPKIRKADESTSISPTIDIVSRITNVLKISNSLGSNMSNVPSSSNSLADCTKHPIHWGLWMHKAHDGQSQSFCVICGEISDNVISLQTKSLELVDKPFGARYYKLKGYGRTRRDEESDLNSQQSTTLVAKGYLRKRGRVLAYLQVCAKVMDETQLQDYASTTTKYRFIAITVTIANLIQPRTTLTDKATYILGIRLKRTDENV
ncbi:hypothetical protein Tco_1019532 [Tanacetum coccineum]|uniref:Uncharacterized protein n=1 Tax=Tanacetum coccineum TaxID=301880 RepID=A0ABQ5FZB9_9ASTR